MPVFSLAAASAAVVVCKVAFAAASAAWGVVSAEYAGEDQKKDDPWAAVTTKKIVTHTIVWPPFKGAAKSVLLSAASRFHSHYTSCRLMCSSKMFLKFRLFFCGGCLSIGIRGKAKAQNKAEFLSEKAEEKWKKPTDSLKTETSSAVNFRLIFLTLTFKGQSLRRIRIVFRCPAKKNQKF